MTGEIKLLSIVGARPQFVKLAAVVRAMSAREEVSHSILHTGQHYDDTMSDAIFTDLDLPRPELNLNIGSESHGRQTAAMLIGIEKYLLENRPDAVLVYGDTNSTLAATLAASKIHVPIAHIEAGLRSYDRAMPEEVNRIATDHCSDRLYAPTPGAMQVLRNENIADRALHVGDVMLDAVRHNVGLAEARSVALAELDLVPGGFGLVTLHRPANTDPASLERLLGLLDEAARQNVPLIFPVHPRTQAVVDKVGYEPSPALRLTGPLRYLDLIALLHAAAVVITDSGGVQKEAAFLRTPCITVRDETEWTETVELGVNRLIGAGAEGLNEALFDACRVDPFGDDVVTSIDEFFGGGDAGRRIAEDCISWLS